MVRMTEKLKESIGVEKRNKHINTADKFEKRKKVGQQ